MKNVISSPFSVTAQKEAVSVDHIDNYYLREASGTTPSVNDSRWTFVPSGGTVPVPTSALPFLWHKYITYLTDGSHYDPIIEFKSSLGQNGIDYDLVPSHSSIIKHENNTVDPANVTCAMVKRNADGSAENLSSIPSGYSIVAYRDNTSSNYTLGSNVSTSGVSVITFVLKYGNVEVERHDIHVITEGAQGLNGRGIQSQDVRFKALAPKANGSAPDTPSTPTNNTQWNEWKTLANANYSATNCYLYKCVKTVYVDGNNNTTTEYYVEGPSVWGQDGKTPFVVDIDNEMTAIPVNSEGKVVSAKTLSFGLKAFYGTENVISSCTVQTVGSLPSGFSANCTTNKAQPSVTIAANTVPSELTEITFRITHTTYGSRDVVFSVAAVKSGGMGEDAVIYQLLPSADEISVGRTADGGYNPSTATLTCGYTKRKGQSGATTVADVSAAFDGYNIYFRRYNRSTGWENYLLYTYWKSHLNNFSVATYSKVEFIICTSTANSVSSPTGIIDRETIPVVADGMNGTSPFIVDLNNEMASVALTSGGSTSAAFSLEIELSAFYGTTDVTTGLSSVTASSDNSNISVDTSTTITDKKIKISIAASKAISATNDIIITAVHPSYGTRSVVFTLAGVKAGNNGAAATLIEILPSLSQISFARGTDGTTLTPDNVTVACSFKQTVGSAISILTSVPSGLVLRYAYNSVPASKTAGNAPNGTSVTVSSSTAYRCLCFALFNNATGALLDRETIPIVKSGTKGDKGDDGRGVYSQLVKFRATTDSSNPDAPNDTTFNSTWKTLAESSYSQSTPYLWKCTRTVFKNSNGTYSDPEFVIEGPTYWGHDGDTPFIIDIDNEMTSIPILANGTVESAITLDFNISAFYGTSNLINDCTVQTVGTLPSGFTVNTNTKSHPVITIAAGTSPAEITEITFRVTHATYGSRDAVFSIAAVKSGGKGNDAVIYDILPSETQLLVSHNANGTYTPANVSLTCGYTKRKGTDAATTVANVTTAFDGYNLYFRLFNRTNSTWTSYYRYYTYRASYLATIAVATYSKVEFIISTNTEATISNDSGIRGLIDRESVPIVSNGMDGSNAFVIDLDNEMSSVALDANGKTTAAFSLTIKLSAFYGTTDVTTGLSTVNESHSDSNITVNKNNVTTNKEITISIPTNTAISALNDITFTATHPTYGTRTVVFSLAGVKAGAGGTAATIQELLPDLTQISFARTSDGTSLTPDSRTVNISIKKTVGASVSTQTISASGLTVRYSTSSMPSSKTAGDNVSSSVTISKTTAASATNLYLAAFNSAGTLVDRETIPIVKDGVSGGSGNGIDSVTFARMFTMGFEAPSETDSGWIESTSSSYPTEAGLSQTNRYLWERKKTTYTKTTDKTYEVSLINQYANGVCANLLEDTAFHSVGEMEAWSVHSGSVLTQENTGLDQNGFGYTPVWTNQYTDWLKQTVYDANLRKLKPNTWYTLSFWGAMTNYQDLFTGSVYNGQNDSSYNWISGAYKSCYLGPGQTMLVTVTGRVATSAVYMRVYVWALASNGSTWEDSKQADITSTSNSTVTLTVKNTSSLARLFYIRPYVYLTGGTTQNTSSSSNNRAYCTLVRINRGAKLNTYLYRSDNAQAIQYGASAPWYVDGKKITAANQTLNDGNSTYSVHDGTKPGFCADGRVIWQLSPTAKRHSVTFKTPSTLSSSVTYSVLFRFDIYAHYGWVSKVKLEENTMATEWIENSYDRYAADFQHIYVGDWKASTSGNASTYYLYALGVRHCVRARKSASESDMTFFRMKKRTDNTGYCSTTQPYADTTNWERADYLKFIAADLLLANEVITDKLTVSKIKGKNDKFVLDENGNVTAQGGTYNSITANQLTVNKGTLTDVQINGSLRNPFTLVGDSFNTDYNDNVSMLSSGGGWVEAYSLPWTVNQSGRVLRLVNFKWGNTTAEGQASINAPSGKYFYEDGITKSELKISREYIELVGYGTSTQFYGWIVVARVDLSTTKRYGHCLKILGFGRVTNTSSGATIDYTTFDGSTMSVTRSSTTGRYTVTFSSNWFAKSTDVRVMVQGYGMVAGSSTSPSKATLNSTTTTSFVVDISDDSSRNNGNFDFIIYNGADFSILH